MPKTNYSYLSESEELSLYQTFMKLEISLIQNFSHDFKIFPQQVSHTFCLITTLE